MYRFAQGATAPAALRVADCPWTRLRREGSKGSEGDGGALRAQILKKKGGAAPPRVVQKGCVRFRSGGDNTYGVEGSGLPFWQYL